MNYKPLKSKRPALPGPYLIKRLSANFQLNLGSTRTGGKWHLDDAGLGAHEFVPLHGRGGEIVIAPNHLTHTTKTNIFLGVVPGWQRNEVLDDLTNREILCGFKEHATRRHVQRVSLNQSILVAATDDFEREAKLKSLILTVFSHGSP